jgi:hypothetical protein
LAETPLEHATGRAEAAAATAHPYRLGAFTREWAALLFAVVSFVIAQLIVVTLHYRATRLTHATEEIKLARGLYSEFYLDGKSYIPIVNAIESCQKLYKGDGGTFTHAQINEYLGFFSDLGLFKQRGALSEELIGHFFGAFIIEANQYPEIQSYIRRIRKNFHQPEAFVEFDSLAQSMESEKRFASLVAFAKTMCNDSPAMSVNRHRPGACPEGPPCTPGD